MPGILDIPAGFSYQQVKVFVAGRPAAGKTSLIRALQGLAVSPDHVETLGLQTCTAWREPGTLGTTDVPTLYTFAEVGGAYAHARPELMAAAREGAAVCLLVFSCTDRAGFLQLSNRLAALGTLPVLLVATKADLASTCSVTMAEVAALAKEQQLPLILARNPPSCLQPASTPMAAASPRFVQLLYSQVAAAVEKQLW